MAVVKNLMVRAGADFSSMRKNMDRAQKDMGEFKDRMNKTMRGIGAGIVIASLGVGAALTYSTKAAMQVEASMQQINRLMGKSSQQFTNWANNSASAFNMSRAEAMKFGAVYSNLLSNFTRDTAETAKYTQDLLETSAIVASATGRTMEDTMDRIRSGLLGNTESIEDLGINVNVAMIESTEAFRRFAGDKSWKQLDFQTQQQIRYFAILEQATKKYGDEVAKNTMSRQQQFIAQLKNIQLNLGNAFLPIYNTVLPALTAFASRVASVTRSIAQFMKILFGSKESQKNMKSESKAVDQQSKSVSGLGDSIKKAGKEAKKAKGQLAGFDEINSLADKSKGSSGVEQALDELSNASTGSSGVVPVDFETNAPKVSQKIRDMAEKVKRSYGEMKDFIKEKSDLIIASLAGVATGFATMYAAMKWGAIVEAVKRAGAWIATTMGAISGPILAIAGLVAGLVASFIYFYRTNETFRGLVDGILNKIKDAALALWNNALVPLGKFVKNKLKSAFNSLTDTSSSLWQNVLIPLGQFLQQTFKASIDAVIQSAKWLWQNVLVPLGQFLLWIWQNVLVPLGTILIELLAIAFKTVASVAKSFWKNVLVPLAKFFAAIFGPTVEAISAVVSFLWKKVFKPLAKFLGTVFKKVFEILIDVITFMWHNVFEPLIKFLSGAFTTVFNTVFESIGDLIEGLQTTLIGIMEFITGVFTGDWEKAWNGVKDIFKGVFDSLYAIVKTPLNLIIDAINSVISGLNSISFDLPDWLPGDQGGKSFGISIPKIPKLARGGIVDGATNFGNFIAGESGAEMIVPLENTSFVDKLASALGTAVMNAMNSGLNNDTSEQDLILNIDGRQLARIMKPYLDLEDKRVGTNIKMNSI